jgi:hypothetical protein
MTWDEIMQMLANVLTDNVVDAYEYGNDVYSKDDIQHLIESEFQNMIENIEFGIGMYIVGIDKRVREKLGVSE